MFSRPGTPFSKKPRTMEICKPRGLYLPAIVIVAVVLLLLLFIGFSTYWNLDRAQSHALRFVHQQGSVIAEVLGTSILLMPDMRDMPDKKLLLDRLINNAGENEAVAYAYIADSPDFALHYSRGYEQKAVGIWQPAFKNQDPLQSRIREFDDSRPAVYEVARKLQISNIPESRTATLVIGMKMQTFEDARREDLHHAVVMVSILAALALSAAFFMYVINRYHRANENLRKNQKKIQQSEKLAALGRMSAAVAHEIRNPLSSIRGFAQFLGHVLKDREKEREYAMIMVREVDRMNRVVTDLLNFARPLEIERTPTDPCELLSHTVRLVQADATERGIAIRQELNTCPESALLDQNLMTQVLLNLLLNAIQSLGDRGQVDAQVKHAADGRHVVFIIEDNGPGIAEGDIQKIFDPFFTTREKGTGLGLAIVRKIVENHDGEILVQSPVPGKDRGCRFIVSLPAT